MAQTLHRMTTVFLSSEGRWPPFGVFSEMATSSTDLKTIGKRAVLSSGMKVTNVTSAKQASSVAAAVKVNHVNAVMAEAQRAAWGQAAKKRDLPWKEAADEKNAHLAQSTGRRSQHRRIRRINPD